VANHVQITLHTQTEREKKEEVKKKQYIDEWMNRTDTKIPLTAGRKRVATFGGVVVTLAWGLLLQRLKFEDNIIVQKSAVSYKILERKTDKCFVITYIGGGGPLFRGEPTLCPTAVLCVEPAPISDKWHFSLSLSQ
jgi:hypothetical protein